MMNQHRIEIFPFIVHIKCAVNGMQVEATLNEIH